MSDSLSFDLSGLRLDKDPVSTLSLDKGSEDNDDFDLSGRRSRRAQLEQRFQGEGNFEWLDPDHYFNIQEIRENIVRELMIFCHERKVSDVCIKTNAPVSCKKDGRMMRVSAQILNESQTQQLASIIANNQDLMSIIKNSRDYDTSFIVKVDRGKFINFRVNITGTEGAIFELSIVMRAIPSEPPLLAELEVEPGILDNFFPPTGLVIVTGPTGSGKTTLLAAALRDMIEKRPCKIGSYEAPIEFNLSRLDAHNSSFVTQCEIGPGRNLRDFPDAAKNALRNAHDCVLLGEARDAATIRGLAELAEQGTTTYTTLHTNSTFEVFSRLISTVGQENRSLLLSVISSLRLIVHQRLVPRLRHEGNADKPGRVALREYFIFDDSVREQLIMANPEQITQVAKELNRREGYGQMLDQAAQVQYDKGEISFETLQRVQEMRK